MEESDKALSAPKSTDLVSFRNKETNQLQYIDLRTGKIHELYKPISFDGFSNELADLICQSIREGKTVKAACTELKLDTSVLYAWLSVFPEFKGRYLEARKQRADFHMDRALDLSESAIGAHKNDIPGLKLAVETHKWAAEKSDPMRFAKPKEESDNVGAITINLVTGVMDKPAPTNIVVDQFGNFKGFNNGSEEGTGDSGVWEGGESSERTETIELSRDRWRVEERREDQEA